MVRKTDTLDVMDFPYLFTGLSPSKRMPLLRTIRAVSYSAMRDFMRAGSDPTILKWS